MFCAVVQEREISISFPCKSGVRNLDQDLRKKVRPSTRSGRTVDETPTSSAVRGEPVEPRCVSPDCKQYHNFCINYAIVKKNGEGKRNC